MSEQTDQAVPGNQPAAPAAVAADVAVAPAKVSCDCVETQQALLTRVDALQELYDKKNAELEATIEEVDELQDIVRQITDLLQSQYGGKFGVLHNKITRKVADAESAK